MLIHFEIKSHMYIKNMNKVVKKTHENCVYIHV